LSASPCARSLASLQKERINGFNILVLFVFVAAVMESVAARFLGTPVITTGLAALAFVVFFAVLCLTTLLFASAGRERALTLGFMASQRNVVLMLVATGGALPDLLGCISPSPTSLSICRRYYSNRCPSADSSHTATRANHMTSQN
jgi:hypothetical protein